MVSYYLLGKADESPTIPFSPIGRDYNYLFTSSDSETDLGTEREIPKVQDRSTWTIMVLVYLGGDCYCRYGSCRVVGDGYCFELVCRRVDVS